MALDYARLRWQSGAMIIEHDAVADMLSAMAVHLASPLPPLALAREGAAPALALKIAESDAAMATACDAVQVFGGAGYICDTGVEKLMRDAKYCQLFPEPNWLARYALLALERQAAAHG
jgi:alkylation response protein AidB-like acyl-CoA dehydrogenase